ncbi:MAG: FliG C-terminal domain-containing protein [Planctomycetota bacterium]
MASIGKRKAAMLLMGLDAGTVAKLLEGLPAEDIQEIALELARIDASGQRNAKKEAKVAQEFCNSLRAEMLTNIVGKSKAEEIQADIKKLTGAKDPFADIRSASTDELVLALEGQHPQTIAVILSELAASKGQEVLSLLDEKVRLKAAGRMVNLESLGGEVRRRMAFMVGERLKSLGGRVFLERPQKQKETLRKLAIMLSALERELRDQLLEEISKQDEEIAKTVRNLMVTWEDIPSVADRSLQDALRAVEASKLAVALYGADEEIAQKIRSNISERAAEALDEEASLMQEPLEKEIHDAREEIVEPLRKANEEGTLRLLPR